MLNSAKICLKRVPFLPSLYRSVRAHTNSYKMWRARQEQDRITSVRFRSEYDAFRKLALSHDQRFRMNWEDRYPCLEDGTAETEFSRPYFYHLSWAARVVARTKPQVHVDISSYVYFAGLLSAFCAVEYYEYRPADIHLSNLECRSADLTRLPFLSESILSLSCMHVVEHIGLGRYGDPLDYDGDLKAIAELKRVVAPGGDLLFVVPIGKPRIEFNAHRVYSYDQIMGYFGGMALHEFALIPDKAEDGHLVYNAAPEFANAQRLACGCFWFVKR